MVLTNCCVFLRSGEVCLEIHDFSWSDVSRYELRLSNEFGAASHSIDVEVADPPTFLEPLRDQVFHLRQNGVLECRVHGIPYPTGKKNTVQAALNFGPVFTKMLCCI